MTIRHLVLSGGGPAGFVTYGILRKLHGAGYWNMSNVKTIYGCSVGAYMGVLISLGYDWNTLDDYLIKRPWEKLTNLTAHHFIEALSSRGLFGIELIEAALEPLLSAKGLTCQTTLKELYEFTGVEIVAYTADVNKATLERVALSHKTYPNLPISTAMAMTMAVPVLFKPVLYEDGCYIDGGIVMNLPIDDCLEETKCEEDEVLALRFIWDSDKQRGINEESSLMEYLMAVMRKSQLSLCTERHQTQIPNKIESVMVSCNGIHTWMEALGNEDMRKSLLAQGEADADEFLKRKGLMKDYLEGHVEELA